MIIYKFFTLCLFINVLSIYASNPEELDPELLNDIFGSSQDTRYNGGGGIPGADDWKSSCNPNNDPDGILCNGYGICESDPVDGSGQCVCNPGYAGLHCNIDESLLDLVCDHTSECVKCFVFGIVDENNLNLGDCLKQCQYKLEYQEYDGPMDAFDNSYKLCKIEQDHCSMEYLATHSQLGLPIYVPKNPHCKHLDETERSIDDVGNYVGMESNKCDDVTSDGYGGVSTHDPKPHGDGYLSYKKDDRYNRKSYRGQFKCGNRHGNGVLDWNDGASFWGEFTDSVRNSTGVMIYANGDIYNGNWTNDVKNGFGIYIWKSNSAIYYGDFVNGKKHGAGDIQYQNGYVISGFFENDGLTRGVVKLPNGDKYTGEIKRGRANVVNGAGEYKEFCSGNTYIGNFVDGQFEGAGIYSKDDDIIYNGSWLNGKPHGSGIYKDVSNGKNYEGTFDHGKMMKKESDCLIDVNGMLKYEECPKISNGY